MLDIPHITPISEMMNESLPLRLDNNVLASNFPRIVAIGFLVSALFILPTAWKNRNRVYYRLMMGLAGHVVMWASWTLVGNAAVPRGTPDVLGAYGTTQTCTAQGFFFQVSFAIPFYCIVMSLYMCLKERSKLDVSKYLWTEKWIHVLVHLFPICSAIYLLFIDAFNANGRLGCWISSIPIGCGELSGIECHRGPQNIEKIQWVFAGLPIVSVCLFPTCVMIAFYNL